MLENDEQVQGNELTKENVEATIDLVNAMGLLAKALMNPFLQRKLCSFSRLEEGIEIYAKLDLPLLQTIADNTPVEVNLPDFVANHGF